MKNIFKTMTKEQALEYCYKHENKYKAGAFEDGEDGVRQFECLIGILESGTIQPSELPEYGMDFETEYVDEEPKQLTTVDTGSIRKICKEYIDMISKHENDDDIEHYVFEEALKAVYGKNIFDYVNSHT
jgi:hypothetical protein